MRTRRTKKEMEAIRSSLFDIAKELQPCTVRQVFYQAVVRGVVDKTDNEYNSTVVRLLTQLRKDGILPFHWISDSTRWIRRPATFDSLQDALRRTARIYRRSLWSTAQENVEIWIEKEALAGVVVDVTNRYDVPLMVSKGYASHTYLYQVAQEAKYAGKPTFVYYFSDRDPSGVDAARFAKKHLAEYSDGAELRFSRVAVTQEQIEDLNLPSRPTKKRSFRVSCGSDSFRVEDGQPTAVPGCAGARVPSRLPFGASLLADSSFCGLDRPLRSGWRRTYRGVGSEEGSPRTLSIDDAITHAKPGWTEEE